MTATEAPAPAEKLARPAGRGPSRWIDPLLAWGAVLPLLAGAALAWIASGNLRTAAMSVTLIWGGAMLVFQAGVRRGLVLAEGAVSSVAALILMLWIFGLAIGSMVSLDPVVSLALLIAGYISLAVIARSETAAGRAVVGHRPSQMLLAVASLGAVAARLLIHA
jgi:uncharacterized RDD family membrane protein YckC